LELKHQLKTHLRKKDKRHLPSRESKLKVNPSAKVEIRKNKKAPDNKETIWKSSFYLKKQYFLPFNSQMDPVGLVKTLI
jgi:hypothetical protein